jgi:hypothetical protein
MIDSTTKKILIYKANMLRTDADYLAYVERQLKELNIQDAKEAFILGAIDSMIHGPVLAMNGREIAKTSLLKEILNDLPRTRKNDERIVNKTRP